MPKPPIVAATDLCLVKLLVGPGATAEKDKTAKSWSEGIGIEVWLPAPANWNERIRNYGGGGWVGGGHRYADQIGSKMPAIVNANLGYASGTTDAGQPWYQDGSFAFLSNGKVNAESLKDFSVRAMVEQAVKTKALVSLYYGKAPKYTYYDGHSQGGRQGMKIMQEYPELYDGYMIAQPAPNIAKFGTSALYPQIVMKTELGYTAVNKDEAKAFAARSPPPMCAPSPPATPQGSASCSIPLPATTIRRATPLRSAPALPATASPAAMRMLRPA